MADIVLAEVSGRGWLIRGEQYIDDLLGNTLDPHVSIEVVACESKSEVDALWQAEAAGDPASSSGADPAEMWMIHPAILNRSKGMAGPMIVPFAPWSAALEPGALQAVHLAVTTAGRAPAAMVTLVRAIPAGSAAMAAAMADLRCALIEAELIRSGVAAQRLRRETIADGEPDRIELIVQPR